MNDIIKTEPPKPPMWKNLGVRFISAVVLIGICIAPFYFGGYVWAALVCLLGGRMVWEWVRMTDETPSWMSYAIPLAALIIGVTYVATQNWPMAWVTIALAAGLAILERSKRGGGLWSGLGLLYILVPSFLIVALRGNEAGFGAPGFLLMIFLIGIVAAADTGAYLGGSVIGGPKMAPKLSPKKTWSGFFSGLLAGVALGAGAALLIGFSPSYGALLAIPVVVFSVLGDFLESGLKRKLDIKDTGGLMPGHGGLLDRLDSLMLVVVVVSIALFISPAIWPL